MQGNSRKGHKDQGNRKVVIQGKIERKKDERGKEHRRKFRVKAHREHEVDFDIEIEEDGDYEFEKLSVDELPTEIEGKPITWLNNFGIKHRESGNYINKRYRVRIPGIGQKRVVIVDNNSHGVPYFYTGPTDNDELILSDGDPGVGHT